jgi:NAD(P)-dependent dehydrogenase (short-subunit alcohol dehydrogenase family)
MKALVTGTSRGLGKAISEAFREKDIEVVELHHEQFHNFLWHPNQTMDNIDILVNNAGIYGPIGKFVGNNWTEWAECIETDLLFPVRLCQRVLPGMIRRGYGKIINISGGGSTKGRPNFSAYSTAKTALVRFTETLAGEVAQYHIDVNAVAPGAMKSELTQKVIDAGPELAGEEDYAEAQTIMQTDAGPERAAKLVAWLASHESDGITGKLISVHDTLEKIAKAPSDFYKLRRISL